MIKAYLTENNKIFFLCPHCGFNTGFEYNTTKRSLNVRCQCGQILLIEVELRKYHRKAVDFYGICFIQNNKISFDIIIKDLSLYGMGLKILSCYKKYLSNIVVGDIIEICFNLENKHETEILKRCIVRSKNDREMGVEFLDENFSTQIGFYLM